MAKTFEQIATEKFEFLTSDYSFRLAERRTSSGFCSLTFTNETAGVGVRITYESREAFVFVIIYRLVGGKIRENPRPINRESELTGYCLDDIVSLLGPGDALKPAYFYPPTSEFYDPNIGMELYVSRFADNLKRYASDVLTGDFRLFAQLETLVKKRAELLRRSKKC